MGIEKREGTDPLPDGIVMNRETIVRGPDAPTTDIVDGDRVVKSAEEIAGEMNEENPDGPEYAPVGTIPDDPETDPEPTELETDDEGNEQATDRGTKAGQPV